MTYLDLATFKTNSIMPASDIDAIETITSGFIEARIAIWTGYINARLRKRYDVPFLDANVPQIVVMWLTVLVTRDAYAKRGFNPTSSEDQAVILDAATTALAEIKEAADEQNGLFDLPLLETADASGITAGGPLVSTEVDPYEWTDHQMDQITGGSFYNG